jgi:hypothetical protein
LVGAAHLQFAAEVPGQLNEIIGLQHDVVEFEERKRLVAVEAQLDAVLGQHAVDREVAADIAQQRDVAQFVEPIGVVDHDRVARPLAETHEIGEDLADPLHVMGDLAVVEQAARFVLARGIADPGRAAAHQHDRLVAGLLEQAQEHDRHEVADMQAVGSAVVADIGGELPLGEARIERRGIGALVDEAALGSGGEKGGTVIRDRGRHGAFL